MKPGDLVRSRMRVAVTRHERIEGLVYKTDVDNHGKHNVYFRTNDGELKCFEEHKVKVVKEG